MAPRVTAAQKAAAAKAAALPKVEPEKAPAETAAERRERRLSKYAAIRHDGDELPNETQMDETAESAEDAENPVSTLGVMLNVKRTSRSRSPPPGQKSRSPPPDRTSPTHVGTSQSSRARGNSAAKIKLEKPDAGEQRRMISKLHYLKGTGKSQAYDDYNSKDLDGKRAWFHEVWKQDPHLTKFHSVMQTKSTFRTL